MKKIILFLIPILILTGITFFNQTSSVSALNFAWDTAGQLKTYVSGLIAAEISDSLAVAVIDSGNVNAGGLSGADIASGGISGTQLMINAVDSTKITNASVSGADLVNPLRAPTNKSYWGYLYADSLLVGTNLFYVSANGNVGIGTASPLGKLHVASYPVYLGDTDDGTVKRAYMVGTQYNHSTEPEGYMVFGGASDSAADNKVNFGGSASGYNAATQLSFYTAANNTTRAGTERVRINSSGNVGIGTTSPITNSVTAYSKSFISTLEQTPAGTDSSITVGAPSGVPTITGAATDASTSTITWEANDAVKLNGASFGLNTTPNAKTVFDVKGIVGAQDTLLALHSSNGNTVFHVDSLGYMSSVYMKMNLYPSADMTYNIGASNPRWVDLRIGRYSFLGDDVVIGHVDAKRIAGALTLYNKKLVVSQELTPAGTDSSITVDAPSGVPTITGAATDGDTSTITWNTGDQQVFSGASGGYTFDYPIKSTAIYNKYALNATLPDTTGFTGGETWYSANADTTYIYTKTHLIRSQP